MDALIHKQSPDIAGAVEQSRERRVGTVSVQSGLASGAGDQASWLDMPAMRRAAYADASGSGEPHREGTVCKP